MDGHKGRHLSNLPLNDNQAAEQAADNTHRDTEVQADAALDRRHHRERKHPIHTPAADDVAHNLHQIHAEPAGCEQQQQEKSANDDTGQSDLPHNPFDIVTHALRPLSSCMHRTSQARIPHPSHPV